MRKNLNIAGFAALGVLAMTLGARGASQEARGGIEPGSPRCEARTNPLGLDVAAPRLSWVLASEQRGQAQTAYQILVASDPAVLARDEGDLWDSGRVASDETFSVVYAGKRLDSHQTCLWKVRVWDRAGEASDWSEPASWSVGILDAGAWDQAAWIGYDAPRRALTPTEAPLEGVSWIWHAADAQDRPQGHRLFVGSLRLPADRAVALGQLFVTADDSYKYTINGTLAASGTGWNQVQRFDVAPHLKPGENTIRVEVENAAQGPAGLLAKLEVVDDAGDTHTLATDGTWKSSASPGPNWHNRALDTAGWPAAASVGQYGDQPWGKPPLVDMVLPPPVHLRGEFQCDKPLKRAVLYTTALGIHDVSLNGQPVSADWFNPGWTDYNIRVCYRAHDVSDHVTGGSNALGITLADGWYSGYIGYQKERDHYGQKPRARLLLLLEYTDGTTRTIATGPDWKAATGGTLEADFLMGESHDARLALDGWDRPGFDASAWAPVDMGAEVQPAIQWHAGPPVRVFEERQAVSITEPRPGVHVLDIGQNLAGVPRLTIQGEAGQVITLRFAERLNPDGTIYTTNLRAARATDTYICKGGGVETWQPRFTFHGFQYIEITGLQSKPTPDTVVALALSSDTPVAGSFACSSPMLNQLHSNIIWTQRANFIDIPTDCPQRDERLGWTGDAQVYMRTATLNCDVQAFFTKWLQDLTDAQREDGQFPMVAPLRVAGPDGGPAWADAGVICPWTAYQVYGDRRLLARQYPSMKRFVEFCRDRCTDELLPPPQFHCFGDWLSINAETPKDVIFMAYFALSTRLTAEAARAMGHTTEAAELDALHARIKAAFQKAYVAEDGRIKGDTQAVYVLALANDLVEGEHAKQAARYLVDDIESKGGHLSTGFIGTKDLMLVLAKIGRDDVAYQLLLNETFPSWGFSIKQGATSIWERWDGWTPENGFQTPGMNSFAHYSFGAVYQWMVENIGGIRDAQDAYKRFRVAPVMNAGLTAATVRYDSIRGPISSEWSVADGVLNLTVTIPANCEAVIVVPTSDTAAVRESGQSVADLVAATSPAGVELKPLGSGTYHFQAPLK